MMIRTARLDAPFWAVVLLALLSLGSLGCFAIAAAQVAPHDAEILTTDDFPPPTDL